VSRHLKANCCLTNPPEGKLTAKSPGQLINLLSRPIEQNRVKIVSLPLKRLINALLNADPEKRPTLS
jgi:hypothetical protein